MTRDKTIAETVLSGDVIKYFVNCLQRFKVVLPNKVTEIATFYTPRLFVQQNEIPARQHYNRNNRTICVGDFSIAQVYLHSI